MINDNIKHKIQRLSKKHFEKIKAIREHLHQHPELSFEEKETSAYVKTILVDLGIEVTDGWAGTGLVGLINGHLADKCIALRADMDALPIQETNNVPYKSKNEGIMHACGHDVHTASLIGTAMILQELKDEIPGCVKLIFQPGEEKLPGGASLMIADGVLDNPKPFAILGQHVHPPLEAGSVGYRPGPYMASADEIYITIRGKGGHAALPDQCVDPIVIASHIIVQMQSIVSRMTPPTSPVVLSFGKINSTGGATNVIPDEVKIAGTLRAMNEELRFKIHEHIKQIAEQVASSFGGSAEVNIFVGYPSLINHQNLTDLVSKGMIEYLGSSNVEMVPIRMTAEDFSYYSQEIPASFYRLGTGNIERGITASVHTSTFDIDASALETSTGTMAYLAIDILSQYEHVSEC